jgi:hypothetical protein
MNVIILEVEDPVNVMNRVTATHVMGLEHVVLRMDLHVTQNIAIFARPMAELLILGNRVPK